MALAARTRWAIGVLLLGVACALVVSGPWKGPTILTLSGTHGIDTGDLPALPLLAAALAIGHARARTGSRRAWWPTGHRAVALSAVALGALLVLPGIVDTADGGALLPAGGGTFGGSIVHADSARADPVRRWSHLALTYDGATLRFYMNGRQVAIREATGAVRRTTDPLWMGGNRPYGEYFHGLIDQVRVYDHALSPHAIRAEMSTPVGSVGTSPTSGLVAAYAFDRGSGKVVADASGHGNGGEIVGATWSTRGRFGGALRFRGEGQAVRIPASASLDLRTAMTLSAWIHPSESQDGWRTIVARQTDAYFLMASGGGQAHQGALDDVRAAIFVGATLWFSLLAGGSAREPRGMGLSWWPPVALFLAGSLVDAALTPSSTLVGPALVAVWYARTASHRVETASVYVVSAMFTAVTVVSLVDLGGFGLARDDGSIARSMALGLLFVTAGVLGALYGSPRSGMSSRLGRGSGSPPEPASSA